MTELTNFPRSDDKPLISESHRRHFLSLIFIPGEIVEGVLQSKKKL